MACITSATKTEKAKYAKQAKALGLSRPARHLPKRVSPLIWLRFHLAGIKLAYQTFLPHHTHLIVNRVQPSTDLCTAAMAGAVIASPAFLSDLFTLATPPPRPANLPSPPAPLTASESVDPEAIKQHTAAMAAWEQSLLRIEPDAGYDWKRWWGKCVLERDWTQAPTALEPDGRYQPRSDEYDLALLGPQPARQTMWNGVMVISFRCNPQLVRTRPSETWPTRWLS